MQVSNQTLSDSPRAVSVDAAPQCPGVRPALADAEAAILKWSGPLFGWLTGLCRDRDRAGDLTQECFAAYWAAVHRETIANPRAWLFRTGRNLFLADLRRRRRSRSLEEENAGAAPETGAAPAEDADRVRAAVFEMPRAIREPLVLRYWCELADAEIADVLCVPLFVVRWRIHNGKAWLRSQLGTLDPSGGDNHVPR